MPELALDEGWSVVQDVHELGEELEVFRDDWDPTAKNAAFSEWEPIPYLAHLQLIFSQNPYFGRELRHYNEHPWWYRLTFAVPPHGRWDHAVLRFNGLDYFGKVWLNGQYLGEHEGYFAPFEFEVGHLLRLDRANNLVVKVSAPWDTRLEPNKASMRYKFAYRDMVKGTYEHADTFVQRDVNPVGLWAGVSLVPHGGVRFIEKPEITSQLADGGERAVVSVVCRFCANEGLGRVTLRCRLYDERTDLMVTSAERTEVVRSAEAQAGIELAIDKPRLWSTWDGGIPSLYRAVVDISLEGEVIARSEQRFGIRSVELRRSESETTFVLNGRRIFLRGTTYFPDAYVSSMSKERYYRDLRAVQSAGFNAVRVHVHVEQPSFYDLCDELGIAVIQDSDLNWLHPSDEAWKDRALRVFGDMVRELRNHPSIVAWICLNEPVDYSRGYLLNVCPGPQLVAEAARLDPGRPTIRGSGAWDDPLSGDSHNYKGSLNGEETRYTDIYGETEKLNTEFGFDAPACAENLRKVPQVYRRLAPIIREIGALQAYQYRLTKYFVEHYRITKYRPCSGYFQFMFIDLSPQSFYGVYDWWGVPKAGVQALEESNQPLGIFMEHKDSPVAIWAVNDSADEYSGAVTKWVVLDPDGGLVTSGERRFDLPGDSALRVADLEFPVRRDVAYRVRLLLLDAEGDRLARNVYVDPFRHPAHPIGHPHRVSHEVGVRLYWA